MINAETIYQKARQLDAFRLQEVSDFIDFLARKNQPIETPHDVAQENTAEKTQDLAEALLAIGQHCAAAPLLDTRTPEQILGYNAHGLPE